MIEIKFSIETNPLFDLQKQMEDKTILKGCEVAELTINEKKKSIKVE